MESPFKLRFPIGIGSLFIAVLFLSLPVFGAQPRATISGVFADFARLSDTNRRLTALEFLRDTRSVELAEKILETIPTTARNQVFENTRGRRGRSFLLSLDREAEAQARSILARLAPYTFEKQTWMLEPFLARLEKQVGEEFPFSLKLAPLVDLLVEQRKNALAQKLARGSSIRNETDPVLDRLVALSTTLKTERKRDFHAQLSEGLEKGRWKIDPKWFQDGAVPGTVEKATGSGSSASGSATGDGSQGDFGAFHQAGYGPEGVPAQPPVGVGNGKETPKNGVSSPAPKKKPGFFWAVSTSAYQWEGGIMANQWLPFEMAGKCEDPAGMGADGFNRWAEDLDLAAGLGCNAFRTSIEWARIEPVRGVFSPEGIAFYHDLFRGMKARGLTPIVTLMHFTHPQWLERDFGGWDDSRCIAEFSRYVDFVSKEYADEVDFWLTFNEPTVFLGAVYGTGQFAPGTTSKVGLVKAALNLLKCHSKAYGIIHANDPVARVSFNHYVNVFKLGPLGHVVFADQPPLTPESPPEAVSEDPEWMARNLALEATRTGKGVLDYFAVDYYCRWRLPFKFLNSWEWEVYPEGFGKSLEMYYRVFKLPILIAENGIATRDLQPRPDGWTREAFIVHHVKEVEKAMKAGVPILGYAHWSITDNWELGSFVPRFGLYSVECRARKFDRIPTPAADVYREIIREGGVTPELLERYPDPRLSGRK